MPKASIGERFEQERRRLGFATKRDLARAVGLSLATVNVFEDRDLEPARLKETRLLLSLGMDLRFVFWGEGPDDERELLHIFRQLDAEDRRRVLAAAQAAKTGG